jgi:hypothetical protein
MFESYNAAPLIKSGARLLLYPSILPCLYGKNMMYACFSYDFYPPQEKKLRFIIYNYFIMQKITLLHTPENGSITESSPTLKFLFGKEKRLISATKKFRH